MAMADGSAVDGSDAVDISDGLVLIKNATLVY